MAKKGKLALDPLRNIAQTGFIGYVEEEAGGPVQEVPLERVLDSPYQTREQVDPHVFERLVHSISMIGFQGFIPVRRHPQQEGFYQIVTGGHSRRDAAKAAGLSTLPVVIVELTDEQAGYGTAFENEVRANLNPVECGRLYLLLRQNLHLSQEELAQKLDTSRDIIKECEAAAHSAPDIQDLLRRLPEGGFRVAKYLRRLDKLDDPEHGIQRATTERVPIIAAYLEGKLTTDGVNLAVQHVLESVEQAALVQIPSAVPLRVSSEGRSDATSEEQAAFPVQPKEGAKTVEASATVHSPSKSKAFLNVQKESQEVHAQTFAPLTIERVEKMEIVIKRFQHYRRLIGDDPPTEKERALLQALQQDIYALLNRE